jgi:PAS domain S-box-containing protein
LKAIMQSSPHDPGGDTVAFARQTGPVNILLVDDEPRNLEVLESVLNSPDYQLIRAQSAQQALLALLDRDFAAIVLDIQMPETNGLELAHLIKQRKRNRHIPIIFLTAYFHDDREVLQGYEVGAVDYLTKPISPQILRSKVAVFVELFRKTRDLAAINQAMELEIEQRLKAELALRQSNSQLEARVEQRTAELTQANEELRLSETALRASQQRLNQILTLMPAGVYTCDADGFISFYNEAAEELWGQKPGLGKDQRSGSVRIFRADGTLLPPEQSPMARALQEGRSIRGEEIVIERADGTRRNVLAYPEPIRNSSGAVIGAVNMLVDITEQKRGEEAARRLAAIVESSGDAIMSKDLTGVLTSWNHGAELLLGYKAEEVVGQPGAILMPEDRVDEEPAILERIRQGHSVDHYETIRRHKDGSLIEISLTVSPIKNRDGKTIGASKILRDITRQKQAERDLERAHAEALAASRAKDDFLAALSHELRTPLNPVLLLASESAEDPTLPAEVRSQFATIRNNVELEARLIDDLLDLTRISRGKLPLDLQPVNIHSLLHDALATLRAELEEKQIKLSSRFDAKAHFVRGDAVRLRQVFWNIFRNAVKFTPRGGNIAVKSDFDAENGELAVSVSDTGIGMTPDELGRAFEAFTQGDHAAKGISHRFGGLGLGLAITRKLVEMHSGSIEAFSEGRDRGASFEVRFPVVGEPDRSTARISGSLPSAVVQRKTNKGTRILLVEDHEPTRKALAHLLTRRHYDVQTAGCVAEARVLAEKGNFHFLISDIGLPDGNGYDLMTELGRRHQLQGIALTGYGMEYDVVRSQASGFLAHLTKPVRVQSLEAVLAAAVAMQRAGGADGPG